MTVATLAVAPLAAALAVASHPTVAADADLLALLLHIHLVELVHLHHNYDLLVAQPLPIHNHNLLVCAGGRRRWR